MNTILLVDDDLIILNLYRHFLKKKYENRFEYVEQESSLEAVKYFEHNHKDIVLIIFDMKMPNIDGEQFIKACNKIKKVPSILITAYGENQQILKLLRQKQFDKLIRKGQVRDDLGICVEELLK